MSTLLVAIVLFATIPYYDPLYSTCSKLACIPVAVLQIFVLQSKFNQLYDYIPHAINKHDYFLNYTLLSYSYICSSSNRNPDDTIYIYMVKRISRFSCGTVKKKDKGG